MPFSDLPTASNGSPRVSKRVSGPSKTLPFQGRSIGLDEPLETLHRFLKAFEDLPRAPKDDQGGAQAALCFDTQGRAGRNVIAGGRPVQMAQDLTYPKVVEPSTIGPSPGGRLGYGEGIAVREAEGVAKAGAGCRNAFVRWPRQQFAEFKGRRKERHGEHVDFTGQDRCYGSPDPAWTPG